VERTVPDLTAAGDYFDLGDTSDAKVREALGSGFPKHPLHKIACIGAPRRIFAFSVISLDDCNCSIEKTQQFAASK
jgi:hypothetical protein